MVREEAKVGDREGEESTTTACRDRKVVVAGKERS
jgi:hypothetical protein